MKFRHHLVTALVTTAGLLACAPIALAHPGHAGTGSFASGVSHPFSGIDHVLVMVAVGLLAARRGGRSLWLLPLTFVGLMLIGGALAMLGMPMPGVEQGIAASVLVLGLALAVKFQPPTWAILSLVGVFAIFHGHAHVTEMQAVSSPGNYAAGFIIATSMLHALGIAIELATRRPTQPMAVLRIAGGGIAACGLLLLVGAI